MLGRSQSMAFRNNWFTITKDWSWSCDTGLREVIPTETCHFHCTINVHGPSQTPDERTHFKVAVLITTAVSHLLASDDNHLEGGIGV